MNKADNDIKETAAKAYRNGHGERSEVISDQMARELLKRAESFKLLNPSQDFCDETMWYGVSIGKDKYLLNSNRKLFPVGEVVEGYALPGQEGMFSKSKFSPKGIKRFIDGETVDPHDLFSKLRNYFSDYVVYKNKSTSTVLALWIMGTYVFRAFRWYGYIWLTSPTKRSGKSTCLDLISHIAFNSTNVMPIPTEAYLFREVSANGSTICLDEIEELKNKNKETYGAVMNLLNIGFKRGGTVGRTVSIGRGIFKPVDFPAFSPKVFAGISSIADTLEDRSFKVIMLRKKRSETIKRFDLRRIEGMLSNLKDDLYIFGLIYAAKIFALYDRPEILEVPEELDDRARDIFEPLFAIARLITDISNQGESAMPDLKVFALDQAGIRAATEQDDSSMIQIVETLVGLNLGSDGIRFLTPGEIFELVKGQPGLEWIETKTMAGRQMKRLGLSSKTHRVDAKVVREYVLTQEIVDDLKERYLPLSEGDISLQPVKTVTLDGKESNNTSVTKLGVTHGFLVDQNDISSSENTDDITDVTDSYAE